MTSTQPSSNTTTPDSLRGTKKRRVPGSCDACKKKKTRCDRGTRPDGQCSNCVAFDIPCTGPMLKRSADTGSMVPVTPEETIRILQNRVRKLEAMLLEVSADTDGSGASPASQPDASASPGASTSLDGATLVASVLEDQDNFFGPLNNSALQTSFVCVANYARRLEQRIEGYSVNPSDAFSQEASRTTVVEVPAPYLFRTVAFQTLVEADVTSGSDEGVKELSGHMARMNLDPSMTRFFGKSSDIQLINDAHKLKEESVPHTDTRNYIFPPRRPEYWNPHPYDFPEGRNQYKFTFPEDDLLYQLVDLYFTHVNPIVPILHRPTFLNELARQLHYHDDNFAVLVLIVCVTGACAGSDDPRVYTEGVEFPLSRGWKWFEQIKFIRTPLLGHHSLHMLQATCILGIYLHSNSGGDAVHYLVGSSLRIVQEIGMHRRTEAKPSVQHELWKRVFWILIGTDRICSTFTGRPFGIQDEDYDLDDMIECDDEYWENPVHPFTQPPGKPSKIAYWNSSIKLIIILGNVCRTIYANKKPKIFMDVKDKDWEQRVVVELDSELNKWHDSVPAHLRWDPEMDDEWIGQSAALLAYYYFVRITIHRAFIDVHDPAKSLLPLLICVNAARACAQVMHTLKERGHQPIPHCLVPVFMSGVVLTLNIWISLKAGRPINPAKEMVYVDKCMEVLEFSELRWRLPGRFRDILKGLCWTGYPSALQPPLQSSLKHGRDDTDNYSSDTRSTPSSVNYQDIVTPDFLTFDSRAPMYSVASAESQQATLAHIPLMFGGLDNVDMLTAAQDFLPYGLDGGMPSQPFGSTADSAAMGWWNSYFSNET